MVEKLFFISNLILCRLLGYPIILAFHRIKKPDGSLLDQCIGATDPEFFEKVLNYLIYLRYRFVSLNELGGMIREQRTEKVAIVTFDDGYKDLYENAFPFLKEFNIPFTLFLITSTVWADNLSVKRWDTVRLQGWGPVLIPQECIPNVLTVLILWQLQMQ